MLKNTLILQSYLVAVLLVCSFLEISAQTIEEGEINGAGFIIVLPENWEGDKLVMYAHGYEETEKYRMEEEAEEEEEFDEEEEANEPEFHEVFTNRGFAFAASEYRSNGLVIREGIEDTEALRQYFVEKYGQPESTVITGHSMGGIITLATVERYPDAYQGAMPLCGWLAPVYTIMKTGFDALVIFDYLFADNSGDIVIGEELVPYEVLEKQAKKGKKDLENFAEHFRLKTEDVAGTMYFMQVVLKETAEIRNGSPVGNLNTIYDGFGFKDPELNKNVKRYAADPEIQRQALEFHTPTGEISDPVLALHTTYDELLPAYSYEYYDQITLVKGTSDLYHQQYVVRDGHCFFTFEETSEAFDQLINWIETGKKPTINYK